MYIYVCNVCCVCVYMHTGIFLGGGQRGQFSPPENGFAPLSGTLGMVVLISLINPFTPTTHVAIRLTPSDK